MNKVLIKSPNATLMKLKELVQKEESHWRLQQHQYQRAVWISIHPDPWVQKGVEENHQTRWPHLWKQIAQPQAKITHRQLLLSNPSTSQDCTQCQVQASWKAGHTTRWSRQWPQIWILSPSHQSQEKTNCTWLRLLGIPRVGGESQHSTVWQRIWWV
jgi:hypothetical protein